jgi:outer membrane protein OmpA-like peptidoglycan-associated protein
VLERNEKVEGKKTVIGYRIKPELYVKHNSAVEIIRNYINAGKTLKASVEYEDYTYNQAVMKIVSNRNEVWVKLEVSEDGKAYKLTILEREALTPTITAGELKTALDRDGKVALYINFETASDVIPADAEAAFTEVVSLLTQNPSYKLSIEGHTDNTGEVSGNQKLSDMRAQSVLKELVKRGITASRLTAKGFGRTKPIADNSTEEGRAKNRRVELVKMK